MNRHPWRKRPEQLVIGRGAVDRQVGLLGDESSHMGECDLFETPCWCTDGLIAVCPPPRHVNLSIAPLGASLVDLDGRALPESIPASTVILECAAGGGAIVRRLLEHGYPDVRALELRPRAIPALRELCPTEWGSWLRFAEPGRGYPELLELCGVELARVPIITNPPFAIAAEFTELALLSPSPWVAMLLRLDVMSAATWRHIFGLDAPVRRDREPLPPRQAGTITAPTTIVNFRRRPSFSGDGKTSMNNYFWGVWEVGARPIDLRPIG